MIPVNISLSTFKGCKIWVAKSFPIIWDGQCFCWTHFGFKFGMKGLLCCLLCFFFRSLFYPAKECRLNYIRKVRKRCSHSRFSSQVIILAFFLTETSACVMFMFFGCYEQLWLFLLSQAMTQGDKKFYLILVFFDFVKIVTW